MKRLSRIPVFTVLACVLVTAAFIDIDIGGYRPGYYDYSPYKSMYHFYHGWPTAFANHAEEAVEIVPPIDTIPAETSPPAFLTTSILRHGRPFTSRM